MCWSGNPTSISFFEGLLLKILKKNFFMAKVTIDGKEYDTDNLSDNVNSQLLSLQFSQNELKRLEAQIAVYKTAIAAYSQALKDELANES